MFIKYFPDVWRRGVAGALMGRVMEEAERRGVRSVYAYVRGDNKVGHKTQIRQETSSKGRRSYSDHYCMILI